MEDGRLARPICRSSGTAGVLRSRIRSGDPSPNPEFARIESPQISIRLTNRSIHFSVDTCKVKRVVKPGMHAPAFCGWLTMGLATTQPMSLRFSFGEPAQHYAKEERGVEIQPYCTCVSTMSNP